MSEGDLTRLNEEGVEWVETAFGPRPQLVPIYVTPPTYQDGRNGGKLQVGNPGLKPGSEAWLKRRRRRLACLSTEELIRRVKEVPAEVKNDELLRAARIDEVDHRPSAQAMAAAQVQVHFHIGEPPA